MLSRQYPPIARYGVLGVSTWPIGCDTPSLFSERLPLRACEVEVRYPPLPHKRGVPAILTRCHMKTRQMDAIPPDTILKRYCAIWGVFRIGPLRVGPNQTAWAARKTPNMCMKLGLKHQLTIGPYCMSMGWSLRIFQ